MASINFCSCKIRLKSWTARQNNGGKGSAARTVPHAKC